MKRTAQAAALVTVAALPVFAQSAGGPKFEVASVKPAVQRPVAAGGVGGRLGGGNGGGCPQSLKMDGGRVDIECATLITLIGYAYRFSPDRIKGPDWMAHGSARFDIAAKIPRDSSASQVPEMVQALLADRFKLVIHRGSTKQPIYALVIGKAGLKLKESSPAAQATVAAAPADPDASTSGITFFGGVLTATIPNANGVGYTNTTSSPRMGNVRETGGPNRLQRWEASSITLEGLAELLDRVTPLSSPIIDMTGLKGRYQMVLEVSLNGSVGAPPAITGTDPAGMENKRLDMEEMLLKEINDGLHKLGLKLERRSGVVECLVVDRVEKMPSDN